MHTADLMSKLFTEVNDAQPDLMGLRLQQSIPVNRVVYFSRICWQSLRTIDLYLENVVCSLQITLHMHQGCKCAGSAEGLENILL